MMNSFALFIKNDGTVWGRGLNTRAQLGIGSNDPTILTTDTKIPIDNVKSISCGSTHTVFFKNDGTVWGCGSNDAGQLGLGIATVYEPIVTKIPIDNVKSISCGSTHTVFLKNDGTVWGCGSSGNIGINNSSTSTSTITKLSIDNVKSISCGDFHTLFVKKDSTVWGCGNNSWGQLAISAAIHPVPTIQKLPIENVKSVSGGTFHSVFLKDDGTAIGYGYGLIMYPSTTLIAGTDNKPLVDIKSISCGDYHTIFLKNDGTVYAHGQNKNGQLGLNNLTNPIKLATKIPIDNIKNVSCGNYYTLFLKTDGNVWGCGSSVYNVINNTTSNIISPVQMTINDVNNIMNWYEISYQCIIKDLNVYKTVENDTLISLGETLPSESDFVSRGIKDINVLFKTFTDGKPKLIDDLSDTFELISHSSNNLSTIGYEVGQSPTIVTPTGNIDTTLFMKINKVEILTTGTGIIRLVVSFDSGASWKTFKNNLWENINLDNDSMKNNGMSPEIISLISADSWDVALREYQLRFAYYLENTNENDNIGADTLRINYTALGGLKKAVHETDYDYIYTSNSSVTVKLLTSGNYRIIYDDNPKE